MGPIARGMGPIARGMAPIARGVGPIPRGVGPIAREVGPNKAVMITTAYEITYNESFTLWSADLPLEVYRNQRNLEGRSEFYPHTYNLEMPFLR